MSAPRAKPSATPLLDAARMRRWYWLFAILGAAILLLPAARPIYRWGKALRARSLAAESARLLGEKKIQEAATTAQAAYQLAPQEAAALRAVGTVYSAAGVPAAFGFWKQLITLPEATDQDRRDATLAAIRARQLNDATSQLARLLSAEPSAPANLQLAIQLAAAKQDRAAALQYLDRLLTLQPGESGAALQRAQILFGSPNAAEQAAGKTALQQLGTGKSPASLPALLVLANGSRQLTAGEVRDLIRQIASHPESTTEHQLIAETLRLQAEPDHRSEILAQAIQRFADSKDLVTLGRWLMHHGENERLLDIVPATEAAKQQDLFLLRLDALAVLGRWTDIQSALETGKPPLEPMHREIFLARASHELKEERSADVHWNRALAAAARNPQPLAYLAQYAQKVGVTDLAVKAWRQLAASSPAMALQAHLALVGLLDAQGDTRALRETMRQIVRLAPTDPAPRNDLAYLDLLLGENLTNAKATARQLVDQNPSVLAYRTTLALAHLRTGEPAEARRIYEGLQIEWEKFPPSAKAVRIAVYQATGEMLRARTLASLIKPETLKPEERALLATTAP